MISLPDQLSHQTSQQSGPNDAETTSTGCEAELYANRDGDSVPIWVPDPSDPNGLEGTWMVVDPAAPNVDPERAAQASAIAKLWATAQR